MAIKNMCEMIFTDGKVLNTEEFVCDGVKVIQYLVECDGVKYHMTKNDGEWAYIISA